MYIPFPVIKITVLRTRGTDKISCDLAGPSTFPEMKYELHANFEASPGYGEQWVKENFPGVPLKIVDTR